MRLLNNFLHLVYILFKVKYRLYFNNSYLSAIYYQHNDYYIYLNHKRIIESLSSCGNFKKFYDKMEETNKPKSYKAKKVNRELRSDFVYDYYKKFPKQTALLLISKKPSLTGSISDVLNKDPSNERRNRRLKNYVIKSLRAIFKNCKVEVSDDQYEKIKFHILNYHKNK